MKTLLLVASTAIYCTCTYYDDSEEIYYRNLRRNNELNLNESFFPQLLNFRVGGEIVTQSEYPWIASVFHSTTKSVPYLCTAVCIKSNIFISAARCVFTLKVVFTSIIYQHQRLTVKALVVPSKPSKQLYDDIGFIISNDELGGRWQTIEIYDQKRTDDNFQWFHDLKFDNFNFEHKVIGFAFPKELQNIPVWHRSVDLVELDVTIGINLCSKILSYNHLISGFPVPCYHSCNLSMFQNGDKLCKNYHGVEGGALVYKKTNKLFGLATWGAHYKEYELPVGFSIPNSKSFYEDFDCAMKIRNNQETVTDGFYQRLCDSQRKSEIY